MQILTYVGVAFLATYLLWIFYLAVMALKRAKEAGVLSKTAYVLGIPVLMIGFLLDFFVNVFVMSIVLVELPRETTVTERLIRHHVDSNGWRLKVVLFLEPILDPFDPSGNHI